jgi:hypothetical protein
MLPPEWSTEFGPFDDKRGDVAGEKGAGYCLDGSFDATGASKSKAPQAPFHCLQRQAVHSPPVFLEATGVQAGCANDGRPLSCRSPIRRVQICRGLRCRGHDADADGERCHPDGKDLGSSTRNVAGFSTWS